MVNIVLSLTHYVLLYQTQILEKDIGVCKHSVNGLRRHIFQIKKDLESDAQTTKQTTSTSPDVSTYQMSRDVQTHIRVSAKGSINLR